MNKPDSRSPQTTQDAWYSYPGKENDVVLSTRVRLARNLASFPFPHAFRSDDAQRVKSLVFDSFSQMDPDQKYQSLAVKNLDPLGQRILSERGVISPETASSPMAGVIVRNDGKIACTVNTSDHVRISAFVTGLNAQTAYTLCKDVDDNLQNTLQFSASKEFGFLTSSLGDCGSGMKISVLVHLPSISAAGFLDRIFKDLMAKAYVISGFYGAGNDSGSSLGSYYQISTSNSFTGSEISQIDELSLVIKHIAEFERKTLKELADNRPTSVRDQVYRALALVKYSRFIGSREGVDLISRIKWGSDAGILSGIENSELFALLYRIQTAHLQYVIRTSELKYEKDVVSEEKKIERLRSLIIQEAVAKVQLTA
ncbi:MAG TPA: hypothetical protein PLR39_00040 [Treponemataceae bacterium]|nr:hypothetical protein [Treponemataceae bacterium]